MFNKDPNKKFDLIFKNDLGKKWKKSKILFSDEDCYICLYDNVNPKNIPNKVIIGINKHTGKLAYGHKFIDTVKNSLKE